MKACLASVPMPICDGGSASVLTAVGLGRWPSGAGCARLGRRSLMRCRLAGGSACWRLQHRRRRRAKARAASSRNHGRSQSISSPRHGHPHSLTASAGRRQCRRHPGLYRAPAGRGRCRVRRPSPGKSPRSRSCSPRRAAARHSRASRRRRSAHRSRSPAAAWCRDQRGDGRPAAGRADAGTRRPLQLAIWWASRPPASPRLAVRVADRRCGLRGWRRRGWRCMATAWTGAAGCGTPRPDEICATAAICSAGPPPVKATSFTASLSAGSWSMRTCAVPLRTISSSCAAARDRSMTRLRAKGPRSLMRTTVSSVRSRGSSRARSPASAACDGPPSVSPGRSARRWRSTCHGSRGHTTRRRRSRRG